MFFHVLPLQTPYSAGSGMDKKKKERKKGN